MIVKTPDGMSHRTTKYFGRGINIKTACGLTFGSWFYEGKKYSNYDDDNSDAPELVARGAPDCMTCLVRTAAL